MVFLLGILQYCEPSSMYVFRCLIFNVLLSVYRLYGFWELRLCGPLYLWAGWPLALFSAVLLYYSRSLCLCHWLFSLPCFLDCIPLSAFSLIIFLLGSSGLFVYDWHHFWLVSCFLSASVGVAFEFVGFSLVVRSVHLYCCSIDGLLCLSLQVVVVRDYVGVFDTCCFSY